jgi:hypothetical protein
LCQYEWYPDRSPDNVTDWKPKITVFISPLQSGINVLVSPHRTYTTLLTCCKIHVAPLYTTETLVFSTISFIFLVFKQSASDYYFHNFISSSINPGNTIVNIHS